MSKSTLYSLLFVAGGLWGLTIPVTKVSVSTGYQPFGLIFWQLAVSIVLLSILIKMRGKSLRLPPEMVGMMAIVGIVGTIIPNSFSYQAAVHLPAGILAIIIAMVPMFALPIAILIGRETPEIRRISGVLVGGIAVILIVAPSANLPEPGQAFYVLLALVGPLCYGAEGNYVAWRGTGSLDAMQLLFGASVIALILIAPVVWSSGQFITPFKIWTIADWAILLNGGLHAGAYSLYIWLIGRAGAVFTSQVSYLVTGSGVLWSMVLLSENYSAWIWASLALMLVGLALVQPKRAS